MCTGMCDVICGCTNGAREANFASDERPGFRSIREVFTAKRPGGRLRLWFINQGENGELINISYKNI